MFNRTAFIESSMTGKVLFEATNGMFLTVVILFDSFYLVNVFISSHRFSIHTWHLHSPLIVIGSPPVVTSREGGKGMNRRIIGSLLLVCLGIPCLLRASARGGDQASAVTLQENLATILDDWVNEYVRHIITPEERDTYHSLLETTEKLDFIELFWKRRDPTPDTPENEYRSEHLRRFTTADRMFSAGGDGWNTDRGRVYIVFGPPYAVNRAPAGAGPADMPSEVWTYNGLPDVSLGAAFDVLFVDFSGSGDFELASSLDASVTFTSRGGFALSGLEGYARSRIMSRSPLSELNSTQRSMLNTGTGIGSQSTL
ncbi:GWxTD domain-containing protein, partial [bacterium]|nr:GWxTD domain-containing protein [candidate division CSSED10-310 bacterium]